MTHDHTWVRLIELGTDFIAWCPQCGAIKDQKEEIIHPTNLVVLKHPIIDAEIISDPEQLSMEIT